MNAEKFKLNFDCWVRFKERVYLCLDFCVLLRCVFADKSRVKLKCLMERLCCQRFTSYGAFLYGIRLC